MSPAKPYRRRLLATIAIVGLTLHSAAQNAASAVSPEVQQLYAEAHVAQSQGDARAAIGKYVQIIRLAPSLAPAYNNLGMLYFNTQQFGQAAETLRKGLTIDPHMGTAQTLLGLSEYRLGHLPDARRDLTKALASDPNNNDAQMALARIDLALGDAASGTEQLRSYLQRNPRDQQAWYLLGKTYLKLSEESLAKIDEIDPDSATAHIIAGEVDESMRNYDGAVAEYTKAEAKAPGQPGMHYHLGNAFWLEEKYGSAADEFRAELLVDPSSCLSQWKLGNSILGANGSPEEALRPLSAAIATCPDLMQAHVDRASALLKLNQPEKALVDLKPAVEATPTEPSIHFLLSRAYKALGRSEEARTELQTYAKLQKEASEATANQAKDVISAKANAH